MKPTGKAAYQHRRLAIILTLVVLGMFGFGFAMVPLYNVLCHSLGINGKTPNTADAASQSVDMSRTILVHFVAARNQNMPWTFKTLVKSVTVHPGESKQVAYFGRNDSDHSMTIQAIPSIVPGLAAKHFKKTQCFCFTHHTLAAHHSMTMPLVFHISKKLPRNIHEIVLSYTLFDLTKDVS